MTFNTSLWDTPNWNNWQHHQQKDMTCYHSEPSISHHLPSPAKSLEPAWSPVACWPLAWVNWMNRWHWCPNVWGVRQDENVVNLAYEIVTMKGEFWVSGSNCWESTDIGPSWWYEPKLKNISQLGSFPQVRVKVKTLWTHHLDMV